MHLKMFGSRAIKKVVAFRDYSMALTTDGTVYQWGGTKGDISLIPREALLDINLLRVRDISPFKYALCSIKNEDEEGDADDEEEDAEFDTDSEEESEEESEESPTHTQAEELWNTIMASTASRTFPRHPMLFSKLLVCIQCGDLQRCAQLLVKDWKALRDLRAEEQGKQHLVATSNLLGAEDHAGVTAWHTAARAGRLDCILLFAAFVQRVLVTSAAGVKLASGTENNETQDCSLPALLRKKDQRGRTALDRAQAGHHQLCAEYIEYCLRLGDNNSDPSVGHHSGGDARTKEKETEAEPAQRSRTGPTRTWAVVEEKMWHMISGLLAAG